MATNYENAKIYKIYSHAGEKIYIGSTTKEFLSQRMATHRSDYKTWKKGESKFSKSYLLFDEYGIENCIIELLEAKPCLNKDDLIKLEGEYTRELECVNKQKINKSLIIEKVNQHQQDHKEKRRQYRKDNKDKIKEYLEANKDKIKEQRRQYRERKQYPEKIKQQVKENLEKMKDLQEKNRERKKKWEEDNKEKRKAQREKYYKDNKEKLKQRTQFQVT